MHKWKNELRFLSYAKEYEDKKARHDSLGFHAIHHHLPIQSFLQFPTAHVMIKLAALD
jgi:hypothetical protein